jgi:hypothetical protein
MSGEIRLLEFPRAEISEVGNECLFGDGDFSLLAEARSKRNQIPSEKESNLGSGFPGNLNRSERLSCAGRQMICSS